MNMKSVKIIPIRQIADISRYDCSIVYPKELNHSADFRKVRTSLDFCKGIRNGLYLCKHLTTSRITICSFLKIVISDAPSMLLLKFLALRSDAAHLSPCILSHTAFLFVQCSFRTVRQRSNDEEEFPCTWSLH